MEHLLARERKLWDRSRHLGAELDQIARELVEMGLERFQPHEMVACGPIAGPVWPWTWNHEGQEWEISRDFLDLDEHKRVLQSCTSYPPGNAPAEAKRVWSQFVVALEQPPIKLTRLFRGGFRALYKDAHGADVVVELGALLRRKQ